MASVILAIGSTNAVSADITLAEGEIANILLVDASGPTLDEGVALQVRAKTSTSEYFTFMQLNQKMNSAAIIGPGDFQVSRSGVSDLEFGAERL